MITTEQAQYWVSRIRGADWNYNYSDDYGAWSRGNSECSSIRKAAADSKLSDEEVQKVIYTYLSMAINDKQSRIDFVIEMINDVFRKK